jgi:hypothetical protein
MPFKYNALLGLGLDDTIPLDGAGKIPSTYLPSYVDDVEEYNNLAAFPATGETGKIYVAKDTGFVYRWSGTVYVQIGVTSAAGSDTQVQFNDGGSFGGDSGLVFNKTTNKLTAGGDVELNDGGSFATTLQTVTPTANRTISFPDATGTVGLVAGSSGQVVYNNAGAYAGVSTMTFDGTSVTLAGRLINSYTSLASSPAKVFTGTWFTGGTSTTTKPHFLIEPSGATSTAWSTSGTGLGVNAASGFAGNLLDLQVNGTSFFRQASNGNIVTNTTLGGGFAGDKDGLFGATYVTGGYHISSGAISAPFIKLGGAGTGSIQLRPDSGYLGWGTTAGSSAGTPDLTIFRDAANTLAQRNGTSAQTSRIYNTFTDASNYERLSTTWSSNVCYTKAENAGTGSARLYVPVTGSTTVASLPSASTAGAGARAFVTDANATTFLSTVAGGGANKVPVVSDGTNWLIG